MGFIRSLAVGLSSLRAYTALFGLTSELPRQVVQTNPSGLHSDRLLACLLASLFV